MGSGNKDFPHPVELFEIKNWWDSLVNEERSYPSFAFFLLSPSDRPMAEYLSNHGKELEKLSGSNCFVLAINTKRIWRFGADSDLQSAKSLQLKNKKLNTAYFIELLKDRVEEGYCKRVADLFRIPLGEFPCFVCFEGIFSQEHVLLTFADMDAEEIEAKLNEVFSTIQKAVSAKKPILKGFEELRTKDSFQRRGKSIVTTRRNIAGKTFQIAIEVWMKSILGRQPVP